MKKKLALFSPSRSRSRPRLRAEKQAPPRARRAQGLLRSAAARRFTLENGLGVTLVPYGTVPKVTVRLAVLTGNVDETANEVWLADLMGDMLTEGTATRTASQIAEDAARMGGSLDVDVGENRTDIGGDVLSEFGPEMVALVADVARNPKFPESELARAEGRPAPPALDREEPAPAARAGEVPRRALRRSSRTAASSRPRRCSRATRSRRSGTSTTSNFGAAPLAPLRRRPLRRGGGGGRDPQGLRRLEARAPPRNTAGRRRRASARSTSSIGPGAVQSTIIIGMPVIDPSKPDWDRAVPDERAARRLLRLAHHLEHPRAEGLHVLAERASSRAATTTPTGSRSPT